MINLLKNIRIIHNTFGIISVASVQLSLAGTVDKPNVIFILIDDGGYTGLGCYGSQFYETPNIDRLATEGIRPEKAGSMRAGYGCPSLLRFHG